jgi:hypothetical protein
MTAPAWLSTFADLLTVVCPGLAAGALLLWSLRTGGWLYKRLTRGKRD